MDDAAPTAPPVVAVVVTHDPGPWFDEVIDGLAAQDYPNLRVLVLDNSADGDVAARVGDRIPGAFVRRLPPDGSFGAAANEALRLVEGSGFFCFLHDDVALDPDAVRQLVEETYRSNAGIVGPKLVEWDEPERLLEVGCAADKFGVPAPLVEPGELDQEQHDAVRDVFFVPSACLLIRTDLFRAIGGFDEGMGLAGEDLDLCWRAHVAGARVLVVPAARARHRAALAERGIDIDRRRQTARSRLRSVLGNYSPTHLLRVLPQHILLTLVLALGAAVTGRGHTAAAELGAWPWNLARIGEIRVKRRGVRATRLVPDREVRALQVRGSARLTAFFRARSSSGERFSAVGAARRNLVAGVHAPRSSIVAWVIYLVLLLIASRSLITDGVAAVGTLLPFPADATGLLREYLSAWSYHGLGAAVALPTGLPLLGLGGLLVFGQMDLLRTLLVVLPLFLGVLGAWRLAAPLGSQRAKITALVVYAAMPLGYNAIATGRWAGLLATAAMPWVLLALARLSGLDPFGPSDQAVDRPFAARVAGLALLTAVVTAFVPLFPLLVVLSAVALLVGTLFVGGVAPMARALLGAVVAALAAVFVLHLPWGWSLPRADNWPTLASVFVPGGAQRGLDDLATFTTGPIRTGWLGWAFLGVVVVAILLGRGWRLAWAARATAIVVLFLGIAWLGDRGTLELGLPAVEVVLAPAAGAVALAAAAGAAAVDRDVAGTRLSWRQPLGTLAAVAVGLVVLPALVAVPDGGWKLGTTDFDGFFAFLPTQRQAGEFRVLWLGDPRNIPGTPWELEEGLGYALSRGGAPDIHDLWANAPRRAEEEIAEAIQLAADGQTSRLGRLLGPMSIRYVVVPLSEAPANEGRPRRPAPDAMLTALASQLDLRAIELDDALVVYENTDWLPVRAQLSAGAAEASATAGFDSLVRADLSGSTAVLGEEVGPREVRGSVQAGTVFVGEGVSSGWELEVDGTRAERRPAFGWANAFEVPTGGTATLRYAPSAGRWILVGLQVVAWLAAIWLATRTRGRAGPTTPVAASGPSPTLIDLGDEAPVQGPPVPVPARREPGDGEPADGEGVRWGGGEPTSRPPDTSPTPARTKRRPPSLDDEDLPW